MLIDPAQRTVEMFRKNNPGIWELHPCDAASPGVVLTSLDWQGTVDDLLG